MAEKLVEIYQRVQEEKGQAGKLQLAVKTGVPATKAALIPDSPEMVARFEKAYKEVVNKQMPLL